MEEKKFVYETGNGCLSEKMNVYSNCCLEDVKNHLKKINLSYQDFDIDKHSNCFVRKSTGCYSSYCPCSEYWVEAKFYEELRETFKGFGENNSVWRKGIILDEVSSMYINDYLAKQQESINKAWEFYKKNFSEKEFGILLENLTFDKFGISVFEEFAKNKSLNEALDELDRQERSDEISMEEWSERYGILSKPELLKINKKLSEDAKDIDILKPFFELDNRELIDCLELEEDEFLEYFDFDEYSNNLDKGIFEKWVKSIDVSDYLIPNVD